MYVLINIVTKKEEYRVETLKEAIELCWYFSNLRFKYVG